VIGTSAQWVVTATGATVQLWFAKRLVLERVVVAVVAGRMRVGKWSHALVATWRRASTMVAVVGTLIVAHAHG